MFYICIVYNENVVNMSLNKRMNVEIARKCKINFYLNFTQLCRTKDNPLKIS